jgi:2-methylcitrate dehydratase PrpD
MTATRELSRHVAELRYEDVPPSIVEQAKRLVLDFFGVALAGARTDTSRIVYEYERTVSVKGHSTVVGWNAALAAPSAAYVNAVSGHSIELDDIDPLALFHAHPPVVSAVLATAEDWDVSGRDFLLAVIAGWEVMTRVSQAANPRLRDRGFHSTPTCGVFGAAAGAAKALGMGEEETVAALGLAGAHSSGLMEMYGPSMQKRINPAPAASAGVRAAFLARAGFTGADTILEGERGFLKAFTGEVDVGPLVAGLGEKFPMVIEFKRYSCARPIHGACDAAIALRERATAEIEVGGIREIVVRRHPAWADYHLNAAPRNYHEAQVSLPFSVSVCLLQGDAFVEQYQDDNVANDSVQALAKKVVVVPDPSLPGTVAVGMEVTWQNGSKDAVQVDHPSGSVENPLDWNALLQKARRLSPQRGEELDVLADSVGSLERLSSIRELTAVAVAKDV